MCPPGDSPIACVCWTCIRRTVFPPTNESLGFIPLGNPGELDSNLIAASQSPFMHPSSPKIQLYYIGNTFGDALPERGDSDSLMLAEIGVDGWAAFVCEGNSVNSATAVVTSTVHVAEGDRLALVLACYSDGYVAGLSNDAAPARPCGSASVTVLDGITAAALGPPSKPVFPTSGEVSAPVDVQWTGSSGLSQGQRVALHVDLRGPVGIFSFTYSSDTLE